MNEYDTDSLPLYEEDESLTEITTVTVDWELNLRIRVNPNREKIEVPYFKVFNNKAPDYNITRVARLHFKDSGMKFINDGYLDWEITPDDIKTIIACLNSKHHNSNSYTNWQRACFLWNYENCLISDIDKYFNGEYDEANKNHLSYVPHNQKMPSTWI
ncbi:MAG: hypothetical protein FWB87_04240 [Defluviitaleaceae bacterium]|nr:hypothetical protein [Defluviitaleaceae bacterium]